MNLNPNQFKALFQLQQDYQVLTQHITELKDLIHQLLEDKCDIDLQFTSHNLARHQKNAEQQKMKDIDDPFREVKEFIQTGGMAGFFLGPIPNFPSGTHKPCKVNFSYKAGESTGIRILNIILSEKQQHLQIVQEEIERILIPSMKIELSEIISNPIQDLHK